MQIDVGCYHDISCHHTISIT